jgi:L-ribulose-5-phosphate 3-epimerase
LKFGYITNGFRDHALEDVFAVLAGLGYRGVGITLDHGHLHPRAGREEVRRVRDLLRRFSLEAVIETGGRYVLDPYKKHWPSLVSAEGRERRMEFYRQALEIAGALDAKVISLWSGVQDPAHDRPASWRLLLENLRQIAKEAAGRGIALGFEPEPGMLVGDLAAYRELRERLGPDAAALKTTLDLGHLQCTEAPPHDRWIREFADSLVNVHVDDVRGRRHDHLPLGEGEIDFPPLLRALEEVRYEGLALVELGRHSHDAPAQAKRSIAMMRSYLGGL